MWGRIGKTNTLAESNYEDIYEYVRNINFNVNSDIELWDTQDEIIVKQLLLKYVDGYTSEVLEKTLDL